MSTHRDMRSSRTCRTLRVSLTAALAVTLCLLYVVGDAFDLVPGYLTYVRQLSSPLSLVHVQTAVKPDSLVADLDTDKPVSPAAARAVVNDLIKTDGVGSDVSVIIADATGHEVVSANPTTPREPASTLKTLTGLAAAEKLDMLSTLDTQVFLTEHRADRASIVLRGNGDMMLQAGPSDPAHINGHAGLQTLADSAAARLKQLGVHRVMVSYDDSLFGAERMPASMDPDMIGNGNFTPTASMAIDQGKQWGSTPRPTDPDALPHLYPARTSSPAAQVAGQFITELKGKDLAVSGQPKSVSLPASTLHDPAALLASVSSAPLWQLLRFTLEQSDNTYADLFGRLVALKLGEANSPAGAVASLLRVLRENKIPTQGLHLADCSGLADGSRLTARTLIDVQERYFSQANAAAMEGLAVSGFSGTALEHTFGKSVRGLIRLKTGTLPTVTSMTGSVLRKGGGLLFYAVIVNKPPSMWSAQRAEDHFVAALAGL